MKKINYLTILAFTAFSMVGCYADKGSYNTDSWTDIASIEGMTVPGTENASFLTLSEDEPLKINPTIRLRPGVDESKFTYDWVLGSDTISSGKSLDWIAQRTPTMEFNAYKEAYFWLAIKNTATGEAWRYFLRDSKQTMLKVKITPATTPNIGTFVYTKADGSVEWGSVKGGDKLTPVNFTMLYTELFARYNPARRIMGPVAGASDDGYQLVIYTNTAPDYGTIIQSTESSVSVMGLFGGLVSDEVFQGAPDGTVNALNFYSGMMQEALVGDGLYLAPATSPNQVILPKSTPTQAGVAQVMGANPYTDVMHFSVMRTMQNELYYYTFDSSRGYRRMPLVDQVGATIKADRIVGVFHQPTFVKKSIKMFVVAKQGAAYTLYTFTLEQVASGSDKIAYADKLDVTSWAGGITDQTLWMTNAIEVPLNYLYIVKDNTLWRTSYESLVAPQAIKIFADPIVWASVVVSKARITSKVNENEVYLSVFTYNQAAGVSKMHTLNAQSDALTVFSSPETEIPGKVYQYLPRY